MEEPRANTAIKCPTDLLAVQTLPSTSAHGDEGVNSRSHWWWIFRYNSLWYKAKRLTNLTVQVNGNLFSWGQQRYIRVLKV